eukprot:10878778-Heterocapsa_arctica.AAC.1
MPINGMDDARLVIWPDAHLAGDKHSSKATGGYWVELQRAWLAIGVVQQASNIESDLDGGVDGGGIRDHLDAAMPSQGRPATSGSPIQHVEH